MELRAPVLHQVGLPTYARPERQQFYLWKVAEEAYAEEKFAGQRDTEHDASLATYDLADWWQRQIVQYLDRARLYLEGAKDAEGDQRRHLEQLAQQALAKATMTAQGAVESSIRVFGDLPKPGLPSGYVEPWVNGLSAHNRLSPEGEG